MLCGRAILVPVVAQGFAGGSFTSKSKLTGSIIWPVVPSARIMAVMRYSSASSKPRIVSSAISCTEEGASTIM